ncbi:neuroligin-4, X-linked [Trichonephila inaurata madagascariensis]|uniref:Neuroligin-4, X-linked n=1 Tax=Trichonephila inaurata madagascariensis TaxID=2747483 RepID=A0A8X7BPT1_9ARAC|nr:neuroligin-4, X-linked [Trichonephila inaurata madagascariensis]
MFVLYCLIISILTVDVVDGQGSRRLMSRAVNTKYGSIRGISIKFPNRNIKPVEAYLGIAYASPPVGRLRFMPPVNPSQWRGVRTTDRFGPVCPQRFPDIRNESESLRNMPTTRLEYLKKMLPYLQNESEDCLYLNVYCPGKLSCYMSYCFAT